MYIILYETVFIMSRLSIVILVDVCITYLSESKRIDKLNIILRHVKSLDSPDMLEGASFYPGDRAAVDLQILQLYAEF